MHGNLGPPPRGSDRVPLLRWWCGLLQRSFRFAVLRCAGDHPSSFVSRRYRESAAGSITPSYDVAVLILDEPVTESVATPVPLAAASPTIGTPITFVGFGCDDPDKTGGGIKRVGTNEVEMIGESSVGSRTDLYFGTFGWRTTAGEADICPGDSGGPAFWSEGGERVVAGVHTLGSQPFGQHGFSTTVSRHRDWIASHFPACVRREEEACGTCGTRVCDASLEWSSCSGDLRTESCDGDGTRVCEADGMWSPCRKPAPLPALDSNPAVTDDDSARAAPDVQGSACAVRRGVGIPSETLPLFLLLWLWTALRRRGRPIA